MLKRSPGHIKIHKQIQEILWRPGFNPDFFPPNSCTLPWILFVPQVQREQDPGRQALQWVRLAGDGTTGWKSDSVALSHYSLSATTMTKTKPASTHAEVFQISLFQDVNSRLNAKLPTLGQYGHKYYLVDGYTHVRVEKYVVRRCPQSHTVMVKTQCINL